jgi:hypothetical protein
VEIGNIEKSKQGSLPRGETKLEVLCTRQTLLGNPFRLHDEDAQMRARVCDLYEDFLKNALAPEVTGSLLDVARASVRRHSHPPGMIGKEWIDGVGARTCDELRQTFAALERVTAQHDGSIRLLCHCAPLRCHTFSIARRLSQRNASSPLDAARDQACKESSGCDKHVEAVEFKAESSATLASAEVSACHLAVKSDSAEDVKNLTGDLQTSAIPIVSTSMEKTRRWGKAKG